MHLKKLAVVVGLALLCGLASVALAQAQSPDALGKAVADNYLEALKKVNELTKDRPDPKDLTPKVEALKEETIKKMVELGKKVEALDAAGKKKADSQGGHGLQLHPHGRLQAFFRGLSSFTCRKIPNWGISLRISTSSPSTPFLTS